MAHALMVDRFGNAGLNVEHERPGRAPASRLGETGRDRGRRRALPRPTTPQTFADVKPGELIVYEDAYRTLAVAINRGDAAATLGLRPDAEVRLRPR